MKSSLKKQLEAVCPGDLVMVNWTDASIGKSRECGFEVDVPVYTWGVYIGIFGAKNKHLVIAQNSFRYADGLYDLDYTAIPLYWNISLTIIVKGYLTAETAQQMVNSFLVAGRRRALGNRKHQERVLNHGHH